MFTLSRILSHFALHPTTGCSERYRGGQGDPRSAKSAMTIATRLVIVVIVMGTLSSATPSAGAVVDVNAADVKWQHCSTFGGALCPGTLADPNFTTLGSEAVVMPDLNSRVRIRVSNVPDACTAVSGQLMEEDFAFDDNVLGGSVALTRLVEAGPTDTWVSNWQAPDQQDADLGDAAEFYHVVTFTCPGGAQPPTKESPLLIAKDDVVVSDLQRELTLSVSGAGGVSRTPPNIHASLGVQARVRVVDFQAGMRDPTVNLSIQLDGPLPPGWSLSNLSLDPPQLAVPAGGSGASDLVVTAPSPGSVDLHIRGIVQETGQVLETDTIRLAASGTVASVGGVARQPDLDALPQPGGRAVAVTGGRSRSRSSALRWDWSSLRPLFAEQRLAPSRRASRGQSADPIAR